MRSCSKACLTSSRRLVASGALRSYASGHGFKGRSVGQSNGASMKFSLTNAGGEHVGQASQFDDHAHTALDRTRTGLDSPKSFQGGMHMTRWTLVLWTLGLAAFSSPAWGQAAAQYGVAAGNSAVTTSRTASALASKTTQLNDRTGSSVKSLVSAMQENR